MTSATWPPGVRRIAHEYMNNSIIVNVGTLDLKAATTVTQSIVMTTLEDKLTLLQVTKLHICLAVVCLKTINTARFPIIINLN